MVRVIFRLFQSDSDFTWPNLTLESQLSPNKLEPENIKLICFTEIMINLSQVVFWNLEYCVKVMKNK